MCHEDVGKCDCHFGTHRGAMGLEKIVSTEPERIFLEYEAKHIFKVSGRDRRVVVVESFVCFSPWARVSSRYHSRRENMKDI